MKKWSVCYEVYASTSIQVEAENEEEARDKADREIFCPSLCWHCAGEVDLGDVGRLLEVVEIQED